MNIVRKEETYKETYTIDDIYALPDGERAELIDSQIYYLATPSRTHQRILFSLSRKIADYIDLLSVTLQSWMKRGVMVRLIG